jgi:hypothetical protein
MTKTSESAAEERGVRRVPGLAVLVGIVLAGLLTGVGFYRWQRGRLDLELAGEVAAAPTSTAERLALWLRFGAAQIHHRLSQVGRFTPEMPWLVTHAVASPDGAPEIWGVDCRDLREDLVHAEGLRVVVELPRPRRLGRATLDGVRADRVPLFASGTELDPAQRLRALALYLLEELPSALERDIPGASLEIRVAAE